MPPRARQGVSEADVVAMDKQGFQESNILLFDTLTFTFLNLPRCIVA